MPEPINRQPLGQSVGAIVDHATALVHEEIELAKAELRISSRNLLRGSVATMIGLVFAVFGVFVLMIGLSFFLSDLLNAEDFIWLGFFIVAIVMFLFGGIAAWIALRKIQKGSHVAPMSIDEARKTQEAIKPEEKPAIQHFEAVAVEETTGQADAPPPEEE